MNSRTKQDLIKFCEAVNELASGTVHLIGLDTAQSIIEASNKLIESLLHDETIL